MSNPSGYETVYTPDAMRNCGLGIWPIMFRGLRDHREILWRLVYRDISVRYRQSILGYLWALLPQLVTAGIFAYLASQRVLPIGELPAPYIPFALWNLAVWQLFAGCLINSTQSLVNAGALVSRASFPKEILVLSSTGGALFDFPIRLIPVIIAFAWHGITPNIAALLLLIVVLLPILFLSLGVGFILAAGNLVFRDASNAISMLMTFAMFLAPILYPPPVREPFALLNFINPFSPLLMATQDLLFSTSNVPAVVWGAYSLFSLLVFFIGWRTFVTVFPRIADKI